MSKQFLTCFCSNIENGLIFKMVDILNLNRCHFETFKWLCLLTNSTDFAPSTLYAKFPENQFKRSVAIVLLFGHIHSLTTEKSFFDTPK